MWTRISSGCAMQAPRFCVNRPTRTTAKASTGFVIPKATTGTSRLRSPSGVSASLEQVAVFVGPAGQFVVVEDRLGRRPRGDETTGLEYAAVSRGQALAL